MGYTSTDTSHLCQRRPSTWLRLRKGGSSRKMLGKLRSLPSAEPKTGSPAVPRKNKVRRRANSRYQHSIGAHGRIVVSVFILIVCPNSTQLHKYTRFTRTHLNLCFHHDGSNNEWARSWTARARRHTAWARRRSVRARRYTAWTRRRSARNRGWEWSECNRPRDPKRYTT